MTFQVILPASFRAKPMLAFGALIAVNAMWAFQFSGARIATSEACGAVLVTLLPLAIATLLVMPFAKLNLDLFRVGNRTILLDVFLLARHSGSPARYNFAWFLELSGRSPPTPAYLP